MTEIWLQIHEVYKLYIIKDANILLFLLDREMISDIFSFFYVEGVGIFQYGQLVTPETFVYFKILEKNRVSSYNS